MERIRLPRELDSLIVMHSLWVATTLLDSLLRDESRAFALRGLGPAAVEAVRQDR